jgi:hypothetical protein
MSSGLAVPFANVWLPALLHLNPPPCIEALEKGLNESAISKAGAGVRLLAGLLNYNHGGIRVDLHSPRFTPPLLLRLLRIAYRHVRIEDDAQHEGSYSPDARDNAEKSWNAVLSALLSTTGSDGWAAKLEMAAEAAGIMALT